MTNIAALRHFCISGGVIKGESHGRKQRSEKPAGYAVNNPEQLAQNMFKLLDVGGRALTLMLKEKRADGAASVAGDMNEAGNMFASVMSRWLTEPEKFAAKQAKLAENFVELWGRTNKRFLGETVEPLAKPAPGDSRFATRNGPKTRSSTSVSKPICSA